MQVLFGGDSPGLGILAAAVGAGMMVYGVSRGEAAVVFGKAVRICMECIGIG